jgi:anaerobic selenocysteine-containing dehydrogenase
LSNPNVLLLAIIGVAVGIILGALPGVSSTMALAILLPLSFSMEPASAILFLIAVFVSSVYGGSISAILINIPGTPGAIVTQLDGYPMTRAGRAGHALTYALIASTLGGLMGLVLLVLLAPLVASAAMSFRSPEFAMVAVFGLVLLAYASGGSTIRGILVGAIGLIRGMYIMGENPAMSDPDLNHAREALCALDHLVVQDIFMTETAWYADVVLPASAWPEKTGTVTNTDRMVQMGRCALDLPGDARQDLWIIQQLATRMGLPWNYPGEHSGVAAVYEEMRLAMHEVIGGISWDRIENESSVTYPCLSADDPGQPTVFIDRFPTADGRVKLVPADIIPADERPDVEYPFVLITGRQLEHWHTGSMTRRASVLDAIEPEATASLHGADLHKLDLAPGDTITVRSRRGEVAISVRRDDGTPQGAVFIPFTYYEAAANLLTNAALDPVGKIPEFKYCAVAIARGGTPAATTGYQRVADEAGV